MKILIFGATGMVGQGVLRACLAAQDVTLVRRIGRTALDTHHARLDDVIHGDLFDYAAIEAQLSGFDACFFCLGVSSAGMSEERYAHLTYDMTLAAAQVLASENPAMVFTYVSGAGTDSTEHRGSMWARVKGRTENALMRLPFKGVYLFRPGVIEPLDGIRSKTKSYRLLYSLSKPLLPLLRKLMPNTILSTADMGRAMLAAARKGEGRRILEARDIRMLASG
jgi:uncharacterized protein YbjT (DUF2867 family)